MYLWVPPNELRHVDAMGRVTQARLLNQNYMVSRLNAKKFAKETGG